MFSFNLFSFNTLLLFISISLIIYFYLKRNFNYWKCRGIEGPPPLVGLGTMYQMFSRDLFTNNMFNVEKYGKVHGLFMGDKPSLMVADPQLIKDMTIKDFNIFVDRTAMVSGDPMHERSVLAMSGEEWKKMRSIISPTFSTGKMRKMHPMIVQCIKQLEMYMDKHTNSEVEVKKMMSSLTMDVIACCAFGTKIDTYSDEKNEFTVNAKKAFRGTWRLWTFSLLCFVSTKILQWTKFSVYDPSVIRFFQNIVRTIVFRREKESGNHNDFIQLMINARNQVQDSDQKEMDDDRSEQLFGQSKTVLSKVTRMQITEMDILANSFLFLVAGYETTAHTLSHMLYSLVMNEKCQQKLYEEIEKYGPDFKYDDISKMPYLEACVAETLRLYNPVSSITRAPSEDYKLGGTGLTIPKGMIVNFDIQSVHHSSEYYPEPMKWDPERFMPENRDKLIPYTYLPFGLGSRNCVGMRFALMEVKTAAAFLLYKYRFFKTNSTPKQLIPKKFDFILNVGEIPIAFELRE